MPRCLPSQSNISPRSVYSAAPGQVSRKHCSARAAFSFLHWSQEICIFICYSSSSRPHDLGKEKFIRRCDIDQWGAGKFGQALFTAAFLVFVTSASFLSSDFSALFLCVGKLAGIAGMFSLLLPLSGDKPKANIRPAGDPRGMMVGEPASWMGFLFTHPSGQGKAVELRVT